MAYLLVLASILIIIAGFTKLSGSRQRHGVPWMPLLIWAVLFGGGMLIWTMTVHAH